MSDPSPIYKNPLKWWSERLADLESKVQYMEDNKLPVPPEDYQLIEVARNYVTIFVTDKLRDE